MEREVGRYGTRKAVAWRKILEPTVPTYGIVTHRSLKWLL
jgi:hypothetical protein